MHEMDVQDYFGNLPPLRTERLILRQARIRDAESLYQCTSDPEVARYVLWEPHRSLAECRSHIRFLHKQYRACEPSTYVVSLRDTDRVIGTIGFTSYYEKNRTAEVGYSFARKYWNHGIATEALIFGLWILLCLIMYRAGHVLHVLWVPVAVTVEFIVMVAVNYVRSQRKRRQITDTFGRYVDHTVMKNLLEKGGDELSSGANLANIAVLFVDIRGFTTVSEAMDPSSVVEILNMFLTLTTDCVMKNHGTLDKFVGDCTMAFWNAPSTCEDPVYRACCAAMDMLDGAEKLQEEVKRRFGKGMTFGVGINWGPAVVGNIGSPKRMDYTAIGDTVNTASRLESNAPGGKILISRAVADALGNRARTTSLGNSVHLKGKSDDFEVLTLDWLERD